MGLELGDEEKPKRYLDKDWRRMPYTEDLIGSVKNDLEQWYGLLVNAASKSTDPNVRQAYERYRTTATLLETLQNGLTAVETEKEEKPDDDTD